MEKRRLGQTDMYVNMVGLGCMGLSHASGTPVAREEAIHILQEAHHIGYDLYPKQLITAALLLRSGRR